MRFMDARVTKLEAVTEKIVERLNGIDVRLAKIEMRLDGFAENMATKADLLALKADIYLAQNNIIRWLVTAVLLGQLIPTLPGLLRSFGLIE